jgi:hypothetical protein
MGTMTEALFLSVGAAVFYRKAVLMLCLAKSCCCPEKSFTVVKRRRGMSRSPTLEYERDLQASSGLCLADSVFRLH